MNTPTDIDLHLSEADLGLKQTRGLEISLNFQGDDGVRRKEAMENLPTIDKYAHNICEYLKKIATEQKNRGKPIQNEEALKRQAAGKMFEDLVQSENSIRPFVDQEKSPNLVDPSEETAEMKERRIKFSQMLTELMHDPKKFGFSLWNIEGFNPDLSFIESRFNKDTGDMMLVITAVGEAKSGRFDSRMYSQITSFRETLERTISIVNKLTQDQARAHNLDGFGTAGTKIGMIRKFKEVVIVPQNIDIRKENLQDRVNEASFRKGTISENEYDYDRFCRILKGELSDEYNIDIKKSSFSGTDLFKISEKVMDLVWKELENDLGGPLSGIVAQHKHTLSNIHH